MQAKLLFILKRRVSYGISYGLQNSCKFILDALAPYGVTGKVVEVVDNNSIDREVSQYKPTHVFIEALWVVPEKFPILIKLHPTVKWYVRLHSQFPFLSHEGIAMQWIGDYMRLSHEDPRFNVAANASRFVEEIGAALDYAVQYLPNVYAVDKVYPHHFQNNKTVHIGCFGAIRQLKNHMEQAIAAMIFAQRMNKHLMFHINASNVEQQHGSAILKNLRNLFYNSSYELVEHDWLSHDDFMWVVSQMDMGMQVSFSETFNIVAADFVASNVPVVVSPEIGWVSSLFQVEPTSAERIAGTMEFAWTAARFGLHYLNKLGLSVSNKRAINTWVNFLAA